MFPMYRKEIQQTKSEWMQPLGRQEQERMDYQGVQVEKNMTHHAQQVEREVRRGPKRYVPRSIVISLFVLAIDSNI